MSITQPSKTKIRTHEFFWLVLLKGYYRKFVKSFGLKGDEKVLDFGCGPGSTSKFIAPILEKEGGELTCLDISPAWIERTRKHLRRFSNVEYYTGDIREWKEKNNYFDAVSIHFMVHDIDKTEREEVARALVEKMKSGAKLIIREPTKKGHGMSPEEIQELMERSGLRKAESTAKKSIIMGFMYTGVFIKPD
jgi:2-polyprenyl-3-methyl-5-hydroxy-6-metoxy-1,4-benzoquinol methylase